MKRAKTICIFLIILNLTSCYGKVPIENILIMVGIGYDLKKDGRVQFSDSGELIMLKSNGEQQNIIFSGVGPTIYSTQNTIQVKMNRKFLLGLEKLYLISEERARFGISDLMEIITRDASRSETAHVAVCKQNSEEIFNLKTPQEEFAKSIVIGEMIQFSSSANFFADVYRVKDLMFMYYQEGRTIAVPYIEIINNRIQITGLALFKKDKMVQKVGLDEARLINMIRNKGGYSYVSVLGESPVNYIDFYCKNNTKVKVSKNGDRLTYDLFVTLTGEINANSLVTYYERPNEQVDKIQNLIEKKVKKELENEILKIQKQYKFDCIDISKYAVAKFGRGKGYDKDEYFNNAEIKVHVKAKITSIGREEK